MIKFIVPAMIWRSRKTGRERQIVDGFYVGGRVPNKARMWRYVAWKQHVQDCASKAGVELPLRPTKTLPFYIVSIAYFASGVHPDPENVLKGVIDALCYVSREEQKILHVKKGSDKYMGGLFFAPQYDKEYPRVEITLLTDGEFKGMITDHFMAVIGRLVEGKEL